MNSATDDRKGGSCLTDADREAARQVAAGFPAWTAEQLDELARIAAAAPRDTRTSEAA